MKGGSCGVCWGNSRLFPFDATAAALYNAWYVAGLVNDLAASESLTDVVKRHKSPCCSECSRGNFMSAIIWPAGSSAPDFTRRP